MKTQKIFLLAVALVLVLFVLASCGASQTGLDYFVFDDKPSFKEPTEFKGEIIEINEDYNLVAFETRRLGTDGYSTRTVEIVDVSDNNRVVYSGTWSKSPDSANADWDIDLDNYPVIKLSEEYQSGTEDGVPVYKTRYEYYLIQKTGKAISLDDNVDKDELEVKEINNIWLIADGDNVYWVNRNLEIMRTIPRIIADTYFRMESVSNPNSFYFQFEAEYCDYLYTWEFDAATASQMIVVYDPNGLASAKYSPSYNGYAPSVFVLNNGNVLIQEQHVVEDGEAYDYVFPFGSEVSNIDLVTKIMDYKTGEVTEVEFNCIIKNLESYYTGSETVDSDFALTLAEGDVNQAYLVPFGDGKIGRVTEYVVLNNSLEIQWMLPNLYLAETGLYNIVNADETGYFAPAVINGEQTACKFNWAGEIVLKVPTNINQITADVYVTESGVYDFDGKLVFDIENSEFCDAEVEVLGDCVYFVKENNLKLGDWYWHNGYDEYSLAGGAVQCIRCGRRVDFHANLDEYGSLYCPLCGDDIGEYEKYEEIYKLDLKNKELVLISDGENTDVEPITTDGAYGVIDYNKQTLTIYTADGEVALITRIDKNVVNIYTCDDAFIVEVEVGGEYKSYIFTLGEKSID